jgi:hypothetical protein
MGDPYSPGDSTGRSWRGSWRGATAFRFREGKVVEYIVGFPTKDAALEAVGLRE